LSIAVLNVGSRHAAPSEVRIVSAVSAAARTYRHAAVSGGAWRARETHGQHHQVEGSEMILADAGGP
jgi:hypothetical protein